MGKDKEREADRLAEERLELMPRSIRDKLDRVGFKVHLSEWRALSLAERARLRDLPCESANEIASYASVVDQLIQNLTGRPPDKITKSKVQS